MRHRDKNLGKALARLPNSLHSMASAHFLLHHVQVAPWGTQGAWPTCSQSLPVVPRPAWSGSLSCPTLTFHQCILPAGENMLFLKDLGLLPLSPTSGPAQSHQSPVVVLSPDTLPEAGHTYQKLTRFNVPRPHCFIIG